MTGVPPRARPVPDVVRAATSFLGRDADLHTALDQLEGSRLVTLTGPGGVGKTRLALELAARVEARHPDGVWVVELGGLRTGAEVAETLAATLGLAAGTVGDVLPRLVDELAVSRVLLVLDNCEHVLATVRPVVDALVRSTTDVTVLATSREPLGVSGERVLNIAPLAVPVDTVDVVAARESPAVRLLTDRATAADHAFVLDEHNLADVVAVVTRLDGLPLAIELAAVRLRSLSAHDLLRHLDERFAVLTRGNEAAPPRHRTLRAVVEWSLDLCTPSERMLWGRLSVFGGGADLGAVLAVCDHEIPAGSVLDDLDSLVAKSVVTVEHVDGAIRYRLLETLAELGREQLEAAGDTDTVRGRHAAFYRRVVRLGRARFWSRDQASAVRELVVERSNLQQTFEFLLAHRVDDGRAALEFAADLRTHWVGRASLREGRRWLDAALAAAPEASVPRATALLAAAWITAMQDDRPAADARLAEASGFVDDLGEPEVTTRVALWSAVRGVQSGAVGPAAAELTRLAPSFLASGDAEDAGLCLQMLVLAQVALGRHDAARETGEKFLRLALDNGDVWSRSHALWTRAYAAWDRGDTVEATSAARQSLALTYEAGDRYAGATALGVLAGASLDNGDPERAATLFGVAAGLWTAVGSGWSALGDGVGGALLAAVDLTRRTLGDDVYTEVSERGRHLTADAAQTFAMQRSAPRSVPTPVATIGETTAASRAVTDALSAREAEVAALVSTGLSNRAIAERLVLSPRTIEGHVERILAKLGFRNRVEIAAWVVAGGAAGTTDPEPVG